MMKFFAALLLSLALVFPAGAQLPGPHSLTEQGTGALISIEIEAWILACRAKKMDCTNILRPIVGYGILPGPYGMYLPGEMVISIDMRLLFQSFSRIVIFHEMVHYLQWVAGETETMNKCAREKEAFDLAWQMNAEMGYVDPVEEPRHKSWAQVSDVGAYKRCFPAPLAPVEITGAR